MKNRAMKLRGLMSIFGVTCSSLLIGLPVLAVPQVVEKPLLLAFPHIVNNKAPYNSRYISQAAPNSPIQPPLPEEQQPPSTSMVLNQGKVSVKLVNHTGAKITYQAIGATAPRSLPGKSDVTLKDLVAPVTVTFKRDDGGLLNATGRSLTPGILELILDATTDLGADKQSMQIQPTGDVFLN
jgi:hypothetical protein